MRNFWNTIALVHEKYGSLRDFDMEIHRQGSGTETNYVSFPLPPKPIDEMDNRHNEFVPDLEGFLNRIGSKEYYDSRLHGIVPDEKNDKKQNAFNSPVITAPERSGFDIDEETVLADRLKQKLSDSPYS